MGGDGGLLSLPLDIGLCLLMVVPFPPGPEKTGWIDLRIKNGSAAQKSIDAAQLNWWIKRRCKLKIEIKRKAFICPVWRESTAQHPPTPIIYPIKMIINWTAVVVWLSYSYFLVDFLLSRALSFQIKLGKSVVGTYFPYLLV